MAFFLVYQFTGGGFNTDEVFGPPDVLPLARYDHVEVNIWYTQDGIAYYLGKTMGASSCRTIAFKYAEAHLLENSTWSYFCCTEEGQSSCDRKLK